MSRKLTQEEFLSKLPVDREYEVVGIYEGMDSNINVKDRFGECSVQAYSLVTGVKPSLQSAIDKEQYFINKAKEVHGDKYTYNNFVYTNGREYSTVTCPLHGDFIQKPHSHLYKRGCPKCKGMKIGGWKRSSFIKIAGERECIFYIIKCWGEKGEEFYKAGITSLSVKLRYNTPRRMPYKYEIVREVKGTPLEVWNFEKECKRNNKNSQYIPHISFGGSSSECFKNIKL